MSSDLGAAIDNEHWVAAARARLDLLAPHRQTDGRHEVRQLQGSGQLDQGEVIGEAAGVPGRMDHCAVGGDLDPVI